MAGHAPPPEVPPELLAEYLENMRGQLGLLARLAERLASASNDRDALATLGREAHKIRGSAGSYGFGDVSRLAAGMEETAKDWAARPDDRDADRGSLAHWFVTRLAEMLGLPAPSVTAGAPHAAAPVRGPLPRVGSPPRPAKPPVAKPPQPPLPRPMPTPPPTSRPPAGASPGAPAKPPAPQRQPPAASPPPSPAPKPQPKASPPSPLPSPPSPPLPPSPPSPPPPAAPSAAAPADLAVPEVIYVEDDASLAELLEYGLRTHGYRFKAYRNGRDALRELLALDVRGTRPLLLLDVDLPALDGYSIFDALQRERPGTYRVVFTTVHGREEEQLRGLEAGALDYLVKPLSLRVALEKIKRWMGR
jgi:CheY-like chemotaxis protein